MWILLKISFFALLFGWVFYSWLINKLILLIWNINDNYIAFLPTDLLVFISLVVLIIIVYLITVFSK